MNGRHLGNGKLQFYTLRLVDFIMLIDSRLTPLIIATEMGAYLTGGAIVG